MSFLPGSGVKLTNVALVTEKPGRIWLIDVATGRKTPVSGAPRVVVSSQGGLLDIVAAPTFAGDQMVYLTYSEPSAAGGSGLALARAKLADIATSPRLEGFTMLWHDPAGGAGGQFGARIAFAPDGQSLFLSSGERQRFTPAQDLSQPLGKILHLTLDGKPAPGNPFAGKTGAASVKITDPPADSDEARIARGRTFTWPGVNLTPAETWSSGHRNPYGLAFAPDGRLWEHDALIAGAFILVGAGIDALRNVRGLRVQIVLEAESRPMETGLLVTDALHRIACCLFDFLGDTRRPIALTVHGPGRAGYRGR